MMHLCSLTGQSQAARLYRYLQERTAPATARDIHESICTMAPSTVVSNVRLALDADPDSRNRVVTANVRVGGKPMIGYILEDRK